VTNVGKIPQLIQEVGLISDECAVTLIYRKWRLRCWVQGKIVPRVL